MLDLFSGAGGAAKGYQLAGWHVTGVDIEPQPDYCGDDFIQADALDFFSSNWRRFDAAHGSPPCQWSCTLTKGTNKGREYINLIPETRRLFRTAGLPSRHRERTGI